MSETDAKIELVEAIVKGGVSVILSVGLLVLFGLNAWIMKEQTEIMRQNMVRQTMALEQISRIYSGALP